MSGMGQGFTKKVELFRNWARHEAAQKFSQQKTGQAPSPVNRGSCHHMPAKSDQPTDEELVTALNAGESDAFDALYHRYSEWVLRMAWRLTRHEDDSLDVLQETFAYLARKFPGFELTAAMTTFLYPAVRNLSIAARRRRQRSIGEFTELQHIPAENSSLPDAHRDLTEALSGISENHREILLLRFVDELNQSEIADRLGLPLGTVKSRLHHAIRAVRQSPAAGKRLQE